MFSKILDLLFFEKGLLLLLLKDGLLLNKDCEPLKVKF